jgi:hypothetical protein
MVSAATSVDQLTGGIAINQAHRTGPVAQPLLGGEAIGARAVFGREHGSLAGVYLAG